jgi:hypothetical protein
MKKQGASPSKPWKFYGHQQEDNLLWAEAVPRNSGVEATRKVDSFIFLFPSNSALYCLLICSSFSIFPPAHREFVQMRLLTAPYLFFPL